MNFSVFLIWTSFLFVKIRVKTPVAAFLSFPLIHSGVLDHFVFLNWETHFSWAFNTLFVNSP